MTVSSTASKMVSRTVIGSESTSALVLDIESEPWTDSWSVVITVIELVTMTDTAMDHSAVLQSELDSVLKMDMMTDLDTVLSINPDSELRMPRGVAV